jgi:hypothetical protein
MHNAVLAAKFRLSARSEHEAARVHYAYRRRGGNMATHTAARGAGELLAEAVRGGDG